MKTWSLALALACLFCLPAIFQAQSSDDYQTGKIVAVEKLPSSGGQSTGGGTDAPATSEVDRYNISIQLNHTIYICRGKMPGESNLDGAQGREVQVRPSGNVMYVKRTTGKTAKLSILGTKKAD
jgi:hypothetical protein